MKIRLTQKVTNISLLTGIIELDEVDCHHIFLGIEQDHGLKNGQLLGHALRRPLVDLTWIAEEGRYPRAFEIWPLPSKVSIGYSSAKVYNIKFLHLYGELCFRSPSGESNLGNVAWAKGAKM